MVYMKEIVRVRDIAPDFPKRTRPTTDCETLNEWGWLLFKVFLLTQDTCIDWKESLLLPISLSKLNKYFLDAFHCYAATLHIINYLKDVWPDCVGKLWS